MTLLKHHSVLTPVVFSLVLIITGCAADKNSPDTAAQKPPASGLTDSLTIELAGRDGVSVLDLTLESHKVEHYESAMGTFVKSIDSIASGSGYWWLFTVNDSVVNAASDKYITKNHDVVKWHFKKP